MTTRIFLVKPSPLRQQGVVLIMGLIMVLLISIVALASIRGSGLQEAMSGNMRDRSMAFQVTESGLADGENVIFSNTLLCDGNTRAGNRCWPNRDAVPANSVQYFDATGFANFGNVSTLNLGTNVRAPSYVLEELETYQPEDGSDRSASINNIFQITAYRVSARGGGISTDSQVVIQSTFNRPAR